jgi:hypothetical protein
LLEERRPLEPFLSDALWSFDDTHGNFRMQRCEPHAVKLDLIEAIC